MIKTEQGRIGMTPEAVKKSDQICVPLGSSTPFIIRLCCDGTAYSVIDNPYVHGLMEKRAFQGAKKE